MADGMMESIRLLANSTRMFCDKLLHDLQVNEEIATGLIEGSLMMVTSLAPVIGYDNAAALAKEAFAEGKTIRELVREKGLLEEKDLNRLLNPDRMTRPGKD